MKKLIFTSPTSMPNTTPDKMCIIGEEISYVKKGSYRPNGKQAFVVDIRIKGEQGYHTFFFDSIEKRDLFFDELISDEGGTKEFTAMWMYRSHNTIPG